MNFMLNQTTDTSNRIINSNDTIRNSQQEKTWF